MSSRVPIVRQISWFATIPQFVVAAVAITIGILLRQAFGGASDDRILRGVEGAVLGSGLYLVYSVGSRLMLTRHHRIGIAFSKRQRFDEALRYHQQSLEFFDRHPWIDRFRCVVMMSPSAMSYREMALCNIAFCHSQIGDGKQARLNYEECLERFPDSAIAQSALKMLNSVADTDRS